MKKPRPTPRQKGNNTMTTKNPDAAEATAIIDMLAEVRAFNKNLDELNANAVKLGVGLGDLRSEVHKLNQKAGSMGNGNPTPRTLKGAWDATQQMAKEHPVAATVIGVAAVAGVVTAGVVGVRYVRRRIDVDVTVTQPDISASMRLVQPEANSR